MKPNVLEGPVMGMIDGRFVRINIKVDDLGAQDDRIRSLAADMPTNMPNAFLLPGGKPAHLQTRSGIIIAWTELDKLRLASVYTVGRDNSVWPVFKERPETSPPEHDAVHVWDPALASMRLFFTSSLKFDTARKQYVWQQSCLVAKAPKRKEVFRPPLSNIFGDSKICMGNEYMHTGPCLADVFCHNLAHFDSSRWNAHALENLSGDAIKALYTFDRDGKQVPNKDFKWWELPCCHPVNTIHFGELPLV